MNGYVPSVGEECEVFNCKLINAAYEKCVPVFIGKHVIVYDSESCNERTANIENCQFRPIPTKADVERELIKEIYLKYFDNELGCQYIAQHIQKDGSLFQRKLSVVIYQKL